ncbi:MAG: hypothetical protein RBR15_17565 [Sphaerochaeta sp.]|nr:hypothetical protein [Sphaerochaeta sp.]
MPTYILAIHLNLAYKQSQDTGEPFDKEAFCKQMNCSAEDVDSAKEMINKAREQLELDRHSYEVSLADKELELWDYPLPSASTKFAFDSPLEDSPIFALSATIKTLELFSTITGGSSDKEIQEYGLPGCIEGIFEESFDEDIAYILMNAFFWILFYNGDRWLSVRSYTIEMLKLFPYPIQSTFHQSDWFIEKFSLFTRRRLATRGICSLQRRPTPWEVKNGLYSIKATGAFYSFLKPLSP